MKLAAVVVIMVGMGLSFVGLKAQADEKANSAEAAIAKEEGKRSRRKKVEMCQECGKPEHDCECHDEKKDAAKK